MIRDRLIDSLLHGCSQLQEMSDSQLTFTEESVENFKHLKRDEKIKIPYDASIEKTQITTMIQRIKEGKQALNDIIDHYEQIVNKLEEKQAIYTNAVIGTLQLQSLSALERFSIPASDFGAASALENARVIRAMEQTPRNIYGGRSRRKTNKKKKRT